ncbi:hypothetical protein NPS70_10975 [Streptomyces sp. C10-9-1]|uniref:hypothetical protein n=1 Tax=Streptomyces sp. C10-9-1 TaxID=1859285 RepID=UPI0021111B16|nr:hypothetical protein [Streptomyces sp. C10-9-1]MCQ6553712.1 hypothetical protein [Streptomyces sp. C10-9-1]
MRTTARLLTGSALVVASIGLGAQASYAGDTGSLEIHPRTVAPGDSVTVSTRACGKDGRGVGDAGSLGAGEFKLRPGTHKDFAVGEFTVPGHTRSGTYGISVLCKNGEEATGDVTVRGHHTPSGHVKTGVGGSVGPDTTQIAAGAAVLSAAAVGGVLLLRRRASGTQGG